MKEMLLVSIKEEISLLESLVGTDVLNKLQEIEIGKAVTLLKSAHSMVELAETIVKYRVPNIDFTKN